MIEISCLKAVKTLTIQSPDQRKIASPDCERVNRAVHAEYPCHGRDNAYGPGNDMSAKTLIMLSITQSVYFLILLSLILL